VSYTLGIDFGTESARGLLVRTENGDEVASAVAHYSHGVIEDHLPPPDADVRLPSRWALQHPLDYLEALGAVVLGVLSQARVDSREVIGLGIDFTSCTVLPVDHDGMPLCIRDDCRRNPHAWVKLWKQHSAQEEADKISRVLAERAPELLQQYGGRISSEWLFPKILETAEIAPCVYEAASAFVEAADWIVWRLTGERVRSACTCGFKGMWRGEYPSEEILEEFSPALRNVVRDKLSESVLPVGRRAGVLNEDGAELCGLRPGTPVAVPLIDAHASVPGCGVADAGRMVMIMGTSICHILLSPDLKPVPGIAGVVEDGIVPGFYAYEAGQPSLGDALAWTTRTLGRSGRADDEAFEELEGGASRLTPGESGLLALDWWNGNRSVLDDSDLSGLILGLTLETSPSAIYRAILEGSAFGTRTIIESMEAVGLTIGEIVACGGVAGKSPLLMQIFADVTGREIRVARSRYTSALGSAICGTVAAGAHESLGEAAGAMAGLRDECYRPAARHRRVYDALYDEYGKLYDHFGRGGSDVMKRLKSIGRA